MNKIAIVVVLSWGVVAAGCGGDSAPPKLGAPGGATTSSQGVQRVSVRWDPVAGATSYNLYWANGPGVTKTNGTKVANVTSPYQHGPLDGGTYYYVVTAVDGHGESAESQETSLGVNLLAFMTSTTGSGDLSSWPDAGGKSGLEAGDAICQARATAAGLAGSFKAWLSSSVDDAYCRIAGFAGKVAANCGRPSLPVDGGPWMRTDGIPFGGSLDQIVDNNWYAPSTQRIYTSPDRDETGAKVSEARMLWTGTYIDGKVSSGGDCGNWTSASASSYGRAGWSRGSTQIWSFYGAQTCDATGSLICLQTGAGPRLPSISTGGKLAFATSVKGTGSLGSWPDAIAAGKTGLDAGDAVCQARAAAAGFSNAARFKAWLSSSSPNTINAASRLTSDGPWRRPDGLLVASSKAELLAGTIASSINQTELGTYLGYGFSVWTGSTSNGTADGTNTCTGWTDGTSGAVGRWGSAAIVDSEALSQSRASPGSCSDSRPIYCLED